MNKIYEKSMYSNNDHITRAQYYFHYSPPSTLLDWNKSYSDHVDTKDMITSLLDNKSDEANVGIVEQKYMGYIE